MGNTSAKGTVERGAATVTAIVQRGAARATAVVERGAATATAVVEKGAFRLRAVGFERGAVKIDIKNNFGMILVVVLLICGYEDPSGNIRFLLEATAAGTKISLLIFAAVLILAISAASFYYLMGIEMNSPQISVGTYHTDNFDQNSTCQVRFPPNTFNEPPKVIVAFNNIAASNDANLRLNSIIERITTDGFTLKMKTWADSTVWSAGITWIAIPSNLGKVNRRDFSFRDKNLPTSGERTHNKNVSMDFDPEQHYLYGAAISRLDFDNSTNIRLKVSTDYQQDDRSLGFSASTWNNTKGARNGASYFIFKAQEEYIQSGYHSFKFNYSRKESMRHTVRFNSVFKTVPNAVVMLSYIDIVKGDHTRVSAKVENVAREGMDIKVRQWDSSRNLHRIGVTWIAVASH